MDWRLLLTHIKVVKESSQEVVDPSLCRVLVCGGTSILVGPAEQTVPRATIKLTTKKLLTLVIHYQADLGDGQSEVSSWRSTK